jgi:hypothetical protein
MVAFLILPAGAFILGALLGWISKCGFVGLISRCAIASVIWLVAVECYMDGPPEALSIRYVYEVICFWFIPWAIYLLVPSLMGTAIAVLIRESFSKGNTISNENGKGSE